MGLIKAAKDAVSTMLADQWREYFYCDSLSNDVLLVKGQKRITEGRNSNTKGIDNIITNGSVIAVNEGQCMLLVDQGEITDFCADAGEFVYDASAEPSLFYGNLGESLKKTFRNVGRRFTFGGNAARDQRVYFVNTKEIMNNLFGTANPIPFRVLDMNIGLDMDVSVRCNGQYSFKIADPLTFYTKISGNVTDSYSRTELLTQMKSEFLNALQPAFARISAMGVRYSNLPAHSVEISNALREELSVQWRELRGIEVVNVSINSATIPQEDAKRISDMQAEASYAGGRMAQALLNRSRAEALVGAAKNEGGNLVGFMGLNMADAMGNVMMNQQGMQQSGMAGAMGAIGAGMGMQVNHQTQQGMGVQGTQTAPGAVTLGWTCSCGQTDNKGKFCTNCGQPKPAQAGWTCSCGAVNQGKFCMNCGSKKPEGAPLFKCDKCGWEPEDPAHPPKFCPECGDAFDESDKQ